MVICFTNVTYASNLVPSPAAESVQRLKSCESCVLLKKGSQIYGDGTIRNGCYDKYDKRKQQIVESCTGSVNAVHRENLVSGNMISGLMQEQVPKNWESQVKNGSFVIYKRDQTKGTLSQRCLAKASKSDTQIKIESCINAK